MAIGNVNPAKVRVTPLAVVYTGRSNVTSLLIEQHNGTKFVPLDLSAASVTRIQLIFPSVSPQILFDSQTTPTAFDQTQGATGILVVDLDTFAIDPGSYVAQLVFFDAAHALGQVIVDGSDNRLQFNFRSVSASGTPPAPVVQWVTEAPTDGQVYGRQNAGWTVVGAGGGNTSQGVADRITVTLAGTVYTINIAATYAGQASITTLGTITAGVWNGSTIGTAYGGAGATLGILRANGAGTVSAALAGTDYVAPGAITGSALTMATARLLGRSTAGSGAVEEITVGANLTLSGGVLSATGGGGSALAVKDEGVDVDTAVVGINFVGAGVTATQASAGQVTVTIPGGGGVSSVNSQTGAVVLVTDDIAEDGAPVNLWFTTARVLATALSGLSLATGGAIVATDTVLAAFGKIQKQLNDHFGAGGTVHALVTASVDGFMSAADKVKLDGVATGATANQTDAFLLDRANHTGTQAISTVTSLQTTLDGKVTNPMTTLGDLIKGGASGAPVRIAVGTNGQVLTVVSGEPAWAAAGGGGLTNWTEAVSTAAPNATTPVVSFAATNAASNVDAAIIPKGNGANLAHVPDNTTTGGNKRGVKATDWQKERNAATQVASGNYATVIGGNNNTASGLSSIVGGVGSTASGAQSVAIGNGCEATAVDSQSFGNGSTSRSLKGARSFSSRSLAAMGDCQVRRVVLLRTVSNATPVIITSDNAAAAANNQLDIPIRSTYLVRGRVAAHNQSTNDAKAWTFDAVLKSTTGGTVSLVSAVTPTVVAEDAGASSWAVTVAADDTLKVLQVTITGNTTGSTRFNCFLESVEVTT